MSDRDERLLGRLLGPGGPEVSCERCFEELDRYVELELREDAAAAEAAVPGMAAHLQGCPACAEEHALLRALVEPPASGAPAQP
ncbi:MAG: hypothetical protein ACTHOE_16500 [Conexibacter sp.]